jgi:hypothetical protein
MTRMLVGLEPDIVIEHTTAGPDAADLQIIGR